MFKHVKQKFPYKLIKINSFLGQGMQKIRC